MNTYRRSVLIAILTVLLSILFFTAGNAWADDPYEDNEELATAWYPGYNWVRTWLSDIYGLGVQSDDDWYRIDVDPAAERIQVDCRFTHADGDIDMELYDSGGNLLKRVYSTSDNEFIDYGISSSGTYYIRVYSDFGNTGNTYDLRWDDLTDDAYEENNARATAWYPEYNWERTWLSDIDGFGIQSNDDWYQIDVDPGSERIRVDCRFAHAEGDIDIGLYDSTGTLLAESNSTTDDNEFIDYTDSVSGIYYIRVYKGNAGNMYDLWWDDLPEDAYEENDTLSTAWHPGFNWERTWLSEIGGLGIQADDDWYRIGVDAASERIQVDCQFTHAEGDIDIELYDSTGELVPTLGGGSVTDNELIDHPISGGGTYYIKVLLSNVGNAYDLRWDDFSTGSTALISDFDVDGVPDIFWRHTSGSNAIWYMEAGGGSVKGLVFVPGCDTGWQVGGVGDFDVDGVPDIFWRHTSGSNAIWYMEAGGTSIKGLVFVPGCDTGWQVGKLGDFDADGVPDIFWRHTSGSNAIWYMEAGGTSIKGLVFVPGCDTGWQVGGVGDFDADGVPDIFWRHTGGSNAIWYMEAGGTSVKGLVFVPGCDTGWQVGKLGDFDADGVPDIFWRHTGGSNAIWYMEAGGTSVKSLTSVPSAGTSWDIGG